jgi:hypothetical protein
MQKVYVPKAVKSGEFEGSVTMKLLSYDERMGILEDASKDGATDAATARKMSKDFKSKWVAVDLKRVSDGTQFKSLDDLQYGPDCHNIINDVMGWLISGDKAEGKTSAPSSDSK